MPSNKHMLMTRFENALRRLAPGWWHRYTGLVRGRCTTCGIAPWPCSSCGTPRCNCRAPGHYEITYVHWAGPLAIHPPDVIYKRERQRAVRQWMSANQRAQVERELAADVMRADLELAMQRAQRALEAGQGVFEP